MRTRRWRTPFLVLTVASGIALIEAAGFAGRAALEGRPVPWLLALRTGLGLWLSMAACTPIAAWTAARFPLERGAMPRRLGVHLVAAVLFVVVHLSLDIGVQTLQRNMRPEPFVPHLAELLSHYLATEVLLYAAVAGAFMLVRAQREARERAVAAEALRAELGEARLRALRSQIAPHFLFNTLNAITTLALRGDGAAVARALTALAVLLRSVLEDQGGHETRLGDELRFVERYLELQQLRFSDRLTVEQRVDPAVLDALVPRLVLQPLAENAVVHGLQGAGGGVVILTARREDATLMLEVTDQRIAGAAAAPDAPRQDPHAGIGLANTRARLAALYGPAQSLDLAHGAAGTTVRIRIPFRTCTLPGAA